MTRHFQPFSERKKQNQMSTKVAVISFTERGSIVGKKLSSVLAEKGYLCTCFAPEKLAVNFGFESINGEYIKWAENIFNRYDVLLFISAVGIAVRGIAPYIKDKFTDPAVIVIDEKENFVVPLLSGHVGGAVEFAKVICEITNAVPVITTATDINNKFAFDVFAVKNDLKIVQRTEAKEISSALLSGENISFCCDWEYFGKIPKGVQNSNKGNIGVVVSVFNKKLYNINLNLVPKKVHLGIGCKKDTPKENIEKAVNSFLKENNIFEEAVKSFATITIKQNEKGIIEFCNEKGWPVKYFTAEDLNTAKGSFNSSEFVKKITGTDNVCERAAVLSSGNGKLIAGKTAFNGVTLAAACEKWSVDFG